MLCPLYFSENVTNFHLLTNQIISSRDKYSLIYSLKCLHYIYVLPHSDKLIILKIWLWTARIFQFFWHFQNKAGNSFFCNGLQHSLHSYLAQINLYPVPKVVVITEGKLKCRIVILKTMNLTFLWFFYPLMS